MIELWHLSSIDWLRELPDTETERLRSAATLGSFPPGATIFAPSPEPETVFILESGLVRIYRLGPSGAELTFGFIHPGEVFGELMAFEDGAPRESFAEAVETCSVLSVGRAAFVRALHSSSTMVFEIAAQIEGRFRKIEARVEDLVFRSARSRVARILLQLSGDFGKEQGKTTLLDVKLTHEELAKLVGTTRPTVSIALGELEDEGLVSRDRGRFVIQKAEALRELALDPV